MNVIKCSRGHFYDADEYSECPHCRNMELYEDVPTKPPVSDVGIDYSLNEQKKPSVDLLEDIINDKI